MILSQAIIDTYISSKLDAWATSTIKSERARLLPFIGQDLSNVNQVYAQAANKYAPYTLKTLFVRLGELLEANNQPNVYKLFMKEKRKLFQNAYQREILELTFEQVRERINKITDPDVRKTCEGLLESGLRANEIRHLALGQVLGKGNKLRSYLGSKDIPVVSYSRLYRGLQQVGLKPHTLRKVFATRLVEAGFKPQDLCQVMGWSSFETAKFYLQPKNDVELKANIKLAVEG